MYDIQALLNATGKDYGDEAVLQRLRTWEADVVSTLKKYGKGTQPSVRLGGGRFDLGVLNYHEQVRLVSQYRDAIGLDDALSALGRMGGTDASDLAFLGRADIRGGYAERISQIWRNLRTTGDITAGNGYGKFNLDLSGDSVISRVYSGLNIAFSENIRPRAVGTDQKGFPTAHFRATGAPRVQSLTAPTPSLADMRGKRVMTFDIETAGLRSGGIHDISYSSRVIGSGEDSVTSSLRFNPRQLQRGVVVDTRGQMPFGKHSVIPLHASMGVPINTTTGAEYIQGSMRFLEQAEAADYIVGHNIESFDVPQIFEGLMGSDKYTNDAQFRSRVDELYSNISAKTVDTARLARNAPNLSKLSVEQALHNRPYSIENILMNTDLARKIGIDRLSEAMGIDSVRGIRGLHEGSIDTMITEGLLEHLGDLKVGKMSHMTPIEREQWKKIQQVVRSSAAVTPFTHITNPDLISPIVKRKMGVDAKVTPLEQEMIIQRNIGRVTDDRLRKVRMGIPTRELLPGLGAFDRMLGRAPGMSFGDVLDRGSRVSGAKFGRYKAGLAARNMPFVGLSQEERIFGTAISELTSKVSGADRAFARYARETMVSRFETFDPSNMHFMTRSGKLTLPVQVLQQSGALTSKSMFGLSYVGPTKKVPDGSINLVLDMHNDRARMGKIWDTLQEIGGMQDQGQFAARMGIDPDKAQGAWEQFQENLRYITDKDKFIDSGLKRGISVAQVYGDPEAVEGIADFLKVFNGADRLSDDRMMRMRLLFSAAEMEDTGRGILYTAGAVLDQGLSPTEHVNLTREVQVAQALNRPPAATMVNGVPVGRAPVTGFAAIADSASLGTTARYIDRARSSGQVDRLMGLSDMVSNRVLPNLPKVGIAGVAAGIAAYALSRRRENQQYSATMESMPMDTGQSRYMLADHIEMRQNAGYDGYRQQIDPLATASLVDNLYYGSIGHSNMAWDRNTALYGGVL